MVPSPRLGPDATPVLLSTIDLPEQVIQELVSHYLSKIHDRPHSLFHPSTLRENIHNGHVSQALLFAICAMGSRFSRDPQIRLLESQLIFESKRLLKADLENICLENIQTCVLVANLCAAHSDTSTEALFFRIANGMANILWLTRFDSIDDLITREVKRRIWWTLFMADRWYSSGLGLSRQMKDFERETELPMDEQLFHSLTRFQQIIPTPWKPGLWAYMITLVELFGPIQDLNRKLVRGGYNEDEIEQQVQHLSRQLDLWLNGIPEDTKLNEDNFLYHLRRGTGGSFVALHLGFHHYSTLLYFQYLDTGRPEKATTNDYTNRCKHHASSVSLLLKRAGQQEDSEAVWPTVGHCLIVSSSVLLHTLLFGDEQLSEVRSSLNSNFEALIELTRYYPCLKSMVNRLDKFQHMCLIAAHLPTYRVDKWMLRFLIEHSLPLEGQDSNLLASVELETLSAQIQRSAEQGRFTNFPFGELSS